MNALNVLNGILWHDYALLIVLATGVLFTFWSTFGQYRALTHGVQVIRGKYDKKDDPGAINHFQALSTALSATVGLGNIAGVAIAISVGGPGAVFWMWVTGFVGMALKMTEVTQAMIYRNTEDRENPHGGAMWVCRRGFGEISKNLERFGPLVGGIFCVTLLVSTITGGNMFQAWNVADITFEYFGIPKLLTGAILTIGVGLVIVGGIKRIGDVAGRIVPFMCGLYILGGLAVIIINYDRIPAIFALILREAFAPSEAVGAFIGGSAAYGFLKGMQRSLFSNEAGQGSAPIAHSAAKTDEPVREGVVAGLEPFVDTLMVCTITALVILLSGMWNREPGLAFVDGPPAITQVTGADGRAVVDAGGNYTWQIADVRVTMRDAVDAKGQMRDGKEVFLVLEGGKNTETGAHHHKISGTLRQDSDGGFHVSFGAYQSSDPAPPRLVGDARYHGIYFGFKGATLTAKAFDRTLVGLGLWIVPATAWLFAFSTIISWSYYGEQGTVYLFGSRGVMPYRVIYCLLVMLSATPFIRTEAELDVVSTLGTGVMLWANIPIMLLFGPKAMRAYHDYMRRLKAGVFKGHAYPKLSDVVDGDDVE
jgi:AGCS family alanine or glycine:cation symporter